MAVSVLVLFVSIFKIIVSHDNFAFMGLFPSIAGVISGLMIVMTGQMTRAIVDVGYHEEKEMEMTFIEVRKETL